jgi:methionyl aminopeptidase
VNEVLMHGIPDSRPLEDGDIVNIDVTVYLDGHHGDCSRTFPVGDKVDPEARRLIRTNEECVERVIARLRPGMDLRFIGEFVE